MSASVEDAAGKKLQLEFLTEAEKELITEVLKRDDRLRRLEEARVYKLKQEVHNIKREGALKASDENTKRCARCREALGVFFWNSGRVCPDCQSSVCGNCKVPLASSSAAWTCKFCYREKRLQLESGAWFNRNRQNRRSWRPKDRRTAADVVRTCLRQTNPMYNARLNRSQDNGILAAQGRDPATASRDPRARISPTPSPLPQRRLTPGTSNQASANTTPMSTPSVSPYPSPCPSPQPPQRRKQNEPTRPRASVPQICVTDCTFERMGDMPDNQIPQSHGGENLPYDDDDGDGYDYDEDFSDDDIDIMVAKHREVSDGRPGYGRKQSTMGGSTGSRESLTSLYSDAAGIYSNAPVSGDVEFALNYVESNLKLLVDVKQCVELGIGDRKKKRTDSYVKVYLLPDKSRASKRKTKPKKNTQNPQYNETLKFSDISLRELQTRTLWLSVWHDDKLGRNVFLGEVQIPLNTFNFQDTMPGWYPLTSRIDSSLQRVVSMDALEPTDKKCHRFKYRLSVSNSHLDELCLAKSKSKKKLIRKPPPSPPIVDMPTGEIAVNIRFIPPSIVASSSSKDRKKKPGKVKLKGDMHCLVKQARNLFGRKATGTDAFCRGLLLPHRKKVKQKTAIVRSSSNPHWNHTFVWEDVSLDELREMSLELTVWDHDRIGTNTFIGGLRLNLGTDTQCGKEVDYMDARGDELYMWQTMIEFPNTWAQNCLPLRRSMARQL